MSITGQSTSTSALTLSHLPSCSCYKYNAPESQCECGAKEREARRQAAIADWNAKRGVQP